MKTYTVGESAITIKGTDYFVNSPLCKMTLSVINPNPANTFIHTFKVFTLDTRGSNITIYSDSYRANTGVFYFDVNFASSISKYGKVSF